VDVWPKGIAAITLFVEDLDAAKQFYLDVFGLPIFFEDNDSAVFKFGDTLVNLLNIAGERANQACSGGRAGGGSTLSVHPRGR
jgi:catechol 2,3-dioxygenase-like lactoylglutathione lyase family enzyme